MTPEPQFLRRFEQIRTSLRRSQAWLGLASTILVAATGLGVLAWADFHRELPRTPRAVGLAVASLATLAVVGRWLIGPLRWWTQPRTASEIEARFPELGQRIRTVVQYGGKPAPETAAQGVKPSLVGALEVETAERTDPLPLNLIVRWRRVQVVAALAVVPVAVLTLAAVRNPEWRVAVSRALLIERPYTTIEVQPGNVLVDQNADVPVQVVLKGRPRPTATLWTRTPGKGDARWKSGPMNRALAATVARIKDPLEYRVVAGPATSGVYSIAVRYPLAIRSLEVEVKPPSYTGLESRTTRGGDIQAVEGSVATIKVALDGIPTSAALELLDLARPAARPNEPAPNPVPAATVLPLQRVGDSFVATLELAKDLDYQVVARTADGRVLPRNKHRIDVVADRAPRVSFDEPDEALEVHTIAEVRHRARVADDFGVARAGIVYRFNDGPEQTLIFQDLTHSVGQKPRLSATLEETLLVENLGATPQDAVTYFAFAEDNYPGTPRRTETDLRYIDFRAFKREYKMSEPGAAGDGDSADLIALDELIARQRVNLNRATRLAKRRPTDHAESDDPLKITGFEETLLNLTREFTAGVEQLADASVDSLHKALDAMQAAIDALDRSQTADAPPAMAEALKHLVAARRELINLIGGKPELARALRAFDRRQAQKIRKPKSKDEEAEELADRLEELAKEEDFVYATIKQLTEPDPTAPSEPKKAETESRDAEPKDGEQPEPRKNELMPASAGPPGDPATDSPAKPDRRALTDKQTQIVDALRDLEEKLKRLEAASDLAKARMAQAADKVEEVAGDLNRGNSKEAAEDARTGAGMLHELARQVKGEIAREATDELAMARDLADELARRESELADRAAGQSPSSSPGTPPGKDGKDVGSNEAKDGPGKGVKDGKDPGSNEARDGTGQGEQSGSGTGSKPGPEPGQNGPGDLTEADQVDRMAEMARTLEDWLKQLDRRGEGKSAAAVREVLDQGIVAEAVERAARMGELRAGDQRAELSREARELAARFEAIGQALEVIHQGIVAPELAALADFDRRLTELIDRLATLKTEAEVAAWQREVATLIRDLTQAKLTETTELADALQAGGGWRWDDNLHHFVATDAIATSIRSVATRIKERFQDLILKDLASARDETTPPAFRELVERYYEVISRGVRAK